MDSLEDRKREERLPERRAFWELIRIIFNEKPVTFTDALRFGQVKTMIFTGLRAGEVALLPLDWKRHQVYTDKKGILAGELGGISRALKIRHFAEKQSAGNNDGAFLFEAAQYIPTIFEQDLSESLDYIVQITEPLRKTIKMQIETGRPLPWFSNDALVSAKELYPYLTGNPLVLANFEEQYEQYQQRYLNSFNPKIFDEMAREQLKSSQQLSYAFYMYFHRFPKDIPFYKPNGELWDADRKRWGEVHFKVSDIEAMLLRDKKSKLSDIEPFKINDGIVQVYDLLFLMPKRALSEQREDGLFDITKTYGIGRFDSGQMGLYLTGSSKDTPSLFELYGKTDEDKKLRLNPHSLRHLQNSELFRLGVADTIITKRFNRKSITQSYEYDHRSLAEELSHIDLPVELEIQLGEKASTVARLIKSNRASGPIVETFRKIQIEQGENAAFEFLSVEADGFHSTPYGHCLNSFTVDPCPKHLECFTGCNHLSATNLPEQRVNLENLLTRLEKAHQEAENKPTTSIGRDNQIIHVKVRIEGIQRLLATPSGEQVFPEGKDLSKINSSQGSLFDDI